MNIKMIGPRHLAGALAGMLALGAAYSANGQESDTATQSVTMEVNEIAVIDVSGNPGTLTIAAPETAGQTPASPTDDSTYAQYTSTVPDGETRRITAQLGTGESAPSGTSLLLEAFPATGEGSSAGQQTLIDGPAEDIVTGIGSVATGDGAEDGAQLEYMLRIDDMTALEAGDTENVTVTLTLTEGSA